MVSSTRTWKNFARERLTVWGKLIIEEFGIDEEDVTREIDYASRALQAIRDSIPKEADKPKVGIRVIAGGPQISTTAVSQTLSRALKLDIYVVGEHPLGDYPRLESYGLESCTTKSEFFWKGSFAAKKFLKRQRCQAAHGSIDITSSLDICEGGLIPRRHKEGHVRQLSNWDA